jgi:hypothetical protein
MQLMVQTKRNKVIAMSDRFAIACQRLQKRIEVINDIRSSVISSYPERFHTTIVMMDVDLLRELDYIDIMYGNRSNSLTKEHKQVITKHVYDLLEFYHTPEEVLVLEYTLYKYDCCANNQLN